MNLHESILDVLRDEVKPALGCTGPISVALAASAARAMIGGEPEKMVILCDKDTYKNSISVVTPGTPYYGIAKPAVVGMFYGDYQLGLEVLSNIPDIDQKKVEDFTNHCTEIKIAWQQTSPQIYIDCTVTTQNGTGRAIIEKRHDRITLLQQNDRIIAKLEDGHSDDAGASNVLSWKIADLFAVATSVDIDQLDFLVESLELNTALAKAGLEEKLGAGFGAAIQKIGKDQMVTKAKYLAASAIDARMSGADLPAMSCATSGNVGITASIPLIAIAEAHEKDNDALLRAVCLSYLITILVKARIGRLSALCACSIGASLGVGVGTVMLLGGGLKEIESTIDNVVGAIGGILCDGAKFGCAFKVTSAIGVAIESAMLALEGVSIPHGNGIVCDNADETLEMLGRIAIQGMASLNEYISRQLITRESK